MKKKGIIVTPGKFYGRLTPGGPLVPTSDAGEPDVVICRRLSDFPHRRVPQGGAVAVCARCAARIVFNPARTVAAPKICMQCADIQPLPFPENPS